MLLHFQWFEMKIDAVQWNGFYQHLDKIAKSTNKK